jgi:hypothetical protein
MSAELRKGMLNVSGQAIRPGGSVCYIAQGPNHLQGIRKVEYIAHPHRVPLLQDFYAFAVVFLLVPHDQIGLKAVNGVQVKILGSPDLGLGGEPGVGVDAKLSNTYDTVAQAKISQ